jgi:glycosylphosphatidylinositol transamidase (GPIT) subunit GPI8
MSNKNDMDFLLELVKIAPLTAAFKAFFFFGALPKKTKVEIEKAIENHMLKFKNTRNPNIVRNTLRWLEEDNFSDLVAKDYYSNVHIQELTTLKETYLNFFELYIDAIHETDNSIIQVADLLTKNEEYLIQIARLRMVVDPEIQLSKNIHKKTGIQYMKVKGFWLNDVGVKERKYFKSLGRFDQYPNGTEDETAILDGRKKIREDIYAEYLKSYPDK